MYMDRKGKNVPFWFPLGPLLPIYAISYNSQAVSITYPFEGDDGWRRCGGLKEHIEEHVSIERVSTYMKQSSRGPRGRGPDPLVLVYMLAQVFKLNTAYRLRREGALHLVKKS